MHYGSSPAKELR